MLKYEFAYHFTSNDFIAFLYSVTFVIILVIIGFPITFFFSWTYNIYPNSEVSPNQNKTNSIFSNMSLKKVLLPLTGFILTVIGGLFWFIYPFLSIGIGNERDYDASIAVFKACLAKVI